MEYARLGASDLNVSQICIGAMAFGADVDEAAADRIVGAALDMGVNFFDTGNTYARGRSEQVLGQAVRRHGRDRCVIATKVFFPTGPDPLDRGLSPPAIVRAVEASLRRLQTDRIDLYLAHRWDADVPVEETLRAFDALVAAGKVRALGASSMEAWRFERALGVQEREGLAPYVCMQSHLNLLYREEEREMLPLCSDRGVAVTAWSPLARGVLAGRSAEDSMSRAYSGEAVVEAVCNVASTTGRPASEVALAWLLRGRRVAAAVVGARSESEIRSAVASTGLELTDDQVERLEAPYRSLPVLGHGDGQRPPRRSDPDGV